MIDITHNRKETIHDRMRNEGICGMKPAYNWMRDVARRK